MNAFNKRSQSIKDSANNALSLQKKLEQYASQTKVISFHIFDTLLERDVDSPDEVKHIVAKRISCALSDDYNIDVSVARIIQLWNEIEHNLRSKQWNASSKETYKFSGIAHELAARLANNDAALIAPLAASSIAYELEIVTKVLFVKPGIAAILSQLNSLGIRVIAISDIALDQSHVHSIFEKKGLTAHFDHIYILSQFDAGMHSEKLFDYVLQQENLLPDELLHIGAADRSVEKLGIHTIHFSDEASIRRQQTLRVYRNLAINNAYWRGRHLLQMIRPGQSQDFYYNYGYEILGPVYATFILGVIEEIKKHKIKQIYFLAREGELFLRLFQMLCPDFFAPDRIPIAHYLYVSRRSTAAAAVHHGLTYQVALLPLLNPKQEGWYSICEAFGLPPDQIVSIARKYGYSDIKQPIHNQESSEFKAMIEDFEFQQIVRQHTTESWQLLHSYLTQHQFFTGQQVAMVDIGWNGSIQKFLQDAFCNLGNYPHVFGLYLGFIGGNRHQFNSAKNTLAGILCDERGKARPGDIFSRFEEIFEEGARALHPTTIGYQISKENGSIVPIFKQNTARDRLEELSANAQIAQFQVGIVDFTREFSRVINLTGYCLNDIKPFVLTLAERAVAFPTATESKQLMQLGHSEDFGSDHVIDFRRETLNLWHILLKPRSLLIILKKANWKYGTAATLGVPGLNTLIRLYDLLKSK